MIKISHDPAKQKFSVSTVLLRFMSMSVPDDIEHSFYFEPPISTPEMAKTVERDWLLLKQGKKQTLTVRSNSPDSETKEIDPMVAFKSAVKHMPNHFIYEIKPSTIRYHPKLINKNIASFIYILFILSLMIWYGLHVSNKIMYISICIGASLLFIILFYTYKL
jgi:hypothetical protein